MVMTIMLPSCEARPDVSWEQKAATDLIKRIRKLRWMGMEDEANHLRAELESLGVVPTDSVLAILRDMD
jgi:hypothetical protein